MLVLESTIGSQMTSASSYTSVQGISCTWMIMQIEIAKLGPYTSFEIN
jgi:hypothetical protein